MLKKYRLLHMAEVTHGVSKKIFKAKVKKSHLKDSLPTLRKNEVQHFCERYDNRSTAGKKALTKSKIKK